MKKLLKITFTLIFTTIILLGFAMPLNPPNGFWYQQFMPNLNNMPISDIIFVDSLNGFAITGDQTPNDTNYVLKTTDSGNNWIIVYRAYRNHLRVKFLNLNTGFVCGGFNTSSGELIKTTNSGNNWLPLNTPGSIWYDDMSVLNEDTMWLVQRSSLDGGVFFTSNGGANWQQQFSGGNQNPNKIYMYNARIGFMSNSSALPNIYKTTNGGVNWNILVSGERFFDISFADSLTGWRTRGDTLKYTSNGGLNWSIQLMPYGGMIQSNVMTRFSALNKDTLWGCGGYVRYPNNQLRGILYRTTNGGNNWQFQVPDTSLPIVAQYEYIEFANKNHGWCYANFTGYVSGIHTTTGGDPVWVTGISQISSEVPENFKLYQNYPNPFNPKTVIKYQIISDVKRQMSNVKLIVYDMTGREIVTLVNKEQTAGTYLVDFSGNGYSSGVYFYKLIVTTAKEVYTETKKMLMIK